MIRSFLKNQAGYTFIEASLVLAVLAILMSVSAVGLSGVQQQTFTSQSLEVLLSDIKQQQLKAMSGYTDTPGQTDRYGIHFETDTYTLFVGDTYDPAASTNFTVSLEGNLIFGTISFPDNTIVFEKGSGEIVGFLSGSDTFTIVKGDGSGQSTVTLNQLGSYTVIDQ